MTDYAYLRCSGISQSDGDGPDRQLGKISAALGQPIQFDHIFQDTIAGKTELADRKALTALMGVVKPGDRIWVERPDRLARDVIASEFLIREFQKADVSIWSAEGNFSISKGDQADPTSKLIRQILAAVSEWEKDSIVNKLRLARQRKKAAGHRVDGKKPYGDKPGEAKVLERIQVLANNHGYTPSLICAELNNSGIKTRKGTSWNSGTISRILKRVAK